MGSNQSSLALKVDLSGKGLKDLEKDLKQPHMLPTFPKLELISLKSNKLTNIPDSIYADIQKSPKVVEFLSVLNLAKNKFETIPDAVWLCGPSPPRPSLPFPFLLHPFPSTESKIPGSPSPCPSPLLRPLRISFHANILVFYVIYLIILFGVDSKPFLNPSFYLCGVSLRPSLLPSFPSLSALLFVFVFEFL